MFVPRPRTLNPTRPSSVTLLDVCRSPADLAGVETRHGLPTTGRLVRHEGLPLQRLSRPLVGVQATIQEGARDEAESIEKRVGRDIRRVSRLHRAGRP